MQIALLTDTHWGARGDSKVFLDMMERFYNDIFFPELKKQNITTVIHLGDIVDRRKMISYVTLNRFRNVFVNRCVTEGIDLHVIVGNHDIPYRNNNDINAMGELFGSYTERGCVSFYPNPTDICVDDLKITIMPWIHDMNYEDCMEHIRNTKSNVLFGHLSLNGFVMHKGMIQQGGMDIKPFQKFELVCSGHFHHKSNKDNIHYLGNPFELTWNDYDDSRGFHLFDTKTLELEFVQNPYRMFHKIFYDDTDKTMDEVIKKDFTAYENTYVKVIVQNKTNPYWFDLMLDKLYKCNPANVSIVDDNKKLSEMNDADIINEAEDTLTIMRNYVGNSNLNVNTTQLNTLLSSLYSESQSLDIE
jgi:DNA repair exonuclease SbcCD nuclease subunit